MNKNETNDRIYAGVMKMKLALKNGLSTDQIKENFEKWGYTAQETSLVITVHDYDSKDPKTRDNDLENYNQETIDAITAFTAIRQIAMQDIPGLINATTEIQNPTAPTYMAMQTTGKAAFFDIRTEKNLKQLYKTIVILSVFSFVTLIFLLIVNAIPSNNESQWSILESYIYLAPILLVGVGGFMALPVLGIVGAFAFPNKGNKRLSLTIAIVNVIVLFFYFTHK